MMIRSVWLTLKKEWTAQWEQFKPVCFMQALISGNVGHSAKNGDL
jgi:hypothetical protein